MTVHLVKLAVGVESAEHLRALQADRRTEREGGPAVAGFTRRRPRRDGELLDGGSLYWVIRGAVRARQRLLGLEDAVDAEGAPFCRLLLDPALVAVAAEPKKAFQGWRYLAPEQAPPDIDEAAGTPGDDGLPPHLVRELRDLGLL